MLKEKKIIFLGKPVMQFPRYYHFSDRFWPFFNCSMFGDLNDTLTNVDDKHVS